LACKPEGNLKGAKMSQRTATKYPGVFYREAKRTGGKGSEKVYYIVFKKDGKTYEEKAGKQFKDDMTPAKAANIRGERIEGKKLSRKELRAQEAARKAAETERWTINRLWESYTETRERNKSLKSDTNNFEKYLQKPFGDKEPKEILELDVDRLRIRISKKLAPQTVKHVLELLRRIVNFGINIKNCAGLSFNLNSKMPTVDNQTTEDLTPEQMQRLLEAIDQDENIQAANLMKLALFTGMRRGELFKLQWKDINEHRGFILIRDPKGGKDQKIPLNEGARQVLKSHIRTESEFVFPGRGGRQRVDINKQVNRIKQKAGLPKNFRPLHGLRHTYASMLASSGQVDLYTLQKLLTHKDSRMTQRYAHLRDEGLKNASNVASDIVREAMKKKTVKLEKEK